MEAEVKDAPKEEAGKERKGIKQHDTYSSNKYKPVGFAKKPNTIRGERDAAKSPETGRWYDVTGADRVEIINVDKLQFVKLFTNCLIETGNLTIPAYKLLFYIMLHLQPDNDWLIINVDHFLDESGYAPAQVVDGKAGKRNRSHYYKGVIELLNREYICKKTGAEHSFFINVNKFFNGDRLKL